MLRISNTVLHRTTYLFSPLVFVRAFSNQQSHDLKSIKNEVEQKLKQMREAKPRIPPPLQQVNSSLCMVFEEENLRESISLGPTLPANKYAVFETFLNIPRKKVVGVPLFASSLLNCVFVGESTQCFRSLNLLDMEKHILCWIVQEETE